MRYRLLLIVLLICLIFTQDLMASAMDKLNNLPSDTMTKFDTMISQFYTPIKTPAIWLFTTLGLIQLVITFGFMLLRGEFELGAVMAALIRFILLFGLFWAFFAHIDWMKDIFNSFTKLADNASKGSVPSLDKAVEKLAKLWDFINKAVDKNGLKDFADTFSLYMIGIIETIVISLLIGYALMTYAFFIFSIYVGVLWIGFGSFDYTRAWAINSVVNIIRWGAKWMMQLLIISVTFTIVNSAILSNNSDFYDYLVLVIISLMMVTISFGSNSFVDSYFNGHGGGDNNAGVAMAQKFISNTTSRAVNTAASTAAGLAGGAMGAISQIKEASAAKADNKSSSNNSSTSSGNKSSASSTKGKASATKVALGAAAGAISGAFKGAMGLNTEKVGQKIGYAIAASLDKKSENTDSKNKDRNGFDLNLIDGEINKSS